MLTILAAVGAGGAVAGGGLLWQAFRPHPLYTYTGHGQAVFVVAWSLDGKRIGSGSGDTTFQVWDALNGGHVFTYRGHSAPCFALTRSPGSQYVASASSDATIQVWSPQS